MVGEIRDATAIDMLTVNSVSILTQKFMEIAGVKPQVGENHRCAYVNSVSGRKLLEEKEPAHVIAAVMSIWGDTPSVTDQEETE